MAGDSLHARTVTEACLYLIASPCPVCGRGPLVPGAERRSSGAEPRFTLDVWCRACHASRDVGFVIDRTESLGPEGASLVINPTDRPSMLLDVGQWLTQVRRLIDLADRSSDKTEARLLRLLAGLCLEEALKFFEGGNDLPPPTALFHSASRQRFRQSPEQFSRTRILAARSRLPKPTSSDLQTEVRRLSCFRRAES